MEKNNSIIDLYISGFDGEIKLKLKQLKEIVERIVPEATEKFSYGMPTYYYYGNLVHFVVNKNHIGFYPAPSGVEYFLKLTNEYPTSKGAIRFDFNKDLPISILEKVIKFRKEENYLKKNK